MSNQKRGRWNRGGHSLHSGANIIIKDLTEYFRESSGAKLQGATRIPSMIRGMSSRQPRPILKGVGFSTVSSGGGIPFKINGDVRGAFQIIGSLSTDVFEPRTSNGSRDFSSLMRFTPFLFKKSSCKC